MYMHFNKQIDLNIIEPYKFVKISCIFIILIPQRLRMAFYVNQSHSQHTATSTGTQLRARRMIHEDARGDKNAIPNLVSSLMPKIYSIIQEEIQIKDKPKGMPKILQLIHILLLTIMFKPSKSRKVNQLLASDIDKKIRKHQMKIARRQRIQFHRDSITTLDKARIIIRKILQHDGITDDQFLFEILTVTFAQKQERTGIEGRNSIQQQKINEGFQMIKKTLAQYYGKERLSFQAKQKKIEHEFTSIDQRLSGELLIDTVFLDLDSPQNYSIQNQVEMKMMLEIKYPFDVQSTPKENYQQRKGY